MKNLYEYVDEKLLAGANKLVRAYNWTTGRTKTDLANKVVFLYTISGCFGVTALSYNYPNEISYFTTSITLPIFLLEGHLNQKENLYQEKKENEILEKNILSIEVEEINHKRKNRSAYNGFCATALTPTIFSSKNPEIGISFSFQMYGNATNNYIMRAGNLPPRKNVFSRAKDKVKKYFKERVKTPSGIPKPEPAFSSLQKNKLFDYF